MSNSDAPGWPSPTCSDGDLRTHTKRLREVARRIGADPPDLLGGAAADEAKEALKDATAAAVERGVFGAPTFFVGEEMYWGNDRLFFVEAVLKGG